MKLKPIGPNQTEVQIGDKLIFFSYETPVAMILDGIPHKTNKRFPNTTSRHVKKWLKEKGFETAIEEDQSFFYGLTNI